MAPADGSDSEESHHGGAAKEEVVDGQVIVEGTKDDDKENVAKDEQKEAKPDGSKPSFTLHIRNLPEELDKADLEMRLARHGEVVSLEYANGSCVAKFKRTEFAFAAREKLNGVDLYGSKVEVEFGPQDDEHYLRGKKKAAAGGTKRKEFLDGDGMVTEVANRRAVRGRGARTWGDDGGTPPPAKRARTDGEGAAPAMIPVKVQQVGNFKPPTRPISRWSENLKFEEQLEDFMKMPRRGMYNRYLVLGKLPPELRTSEAIWRVIAPVQREIVQIEMITCFGKPVAHVALRNATGAATMHRLAEQMLPHLTVAFAPPRRASPTLWLGNIDDFVNRKDLEELLGQFGKLLNGLRYVPARTCAFASFSEVGEAINARNCLYGLEVNKNQYLNADFTDEVVEPPDGYMWGAPPWGAARGPWMPWADPRANWGMYSNWGDQQRRRGDEPWRGQDAVRPARAGERERDGRRRRSRTPTKKSREASREPKQRRRAAAAPSPPASSAEPPAVQVPKAKVKLYKMGGLCCHIVATYVKGHARPEQLQSKLHIDQRTKIDHCRSHMERAGELATIWHFSAADRKDCGAYDALCDYFVEKERVGLVQNPSHYVYVVPPTEGYLKELKLPMSNFVVAIQIPIKK